MSIRKFFGHALDFAQCGDKHDAAKVLKGFGNAGILEIVEDGCGGTYRVVYTIKLKEAVFVLHVFQKKSKHGMATPKPDLDIIRECLKVAEQLVKEMLMKKRKIKGVEVEMSSGNVFADLGLRDADKLKIKSGLVIEITKAVRRLGLSQAEAGRRMGLPQPKVSGLFRGEFANVSERKLMECLNRLGDDVEIRVKPAARGTGHLRLAAA